MSEVPSINYEFVAVEEALRRVKRAKSGTWFWIVVGQFAPSKGQTHADLHDGATLRGYALQGNIRVSRKEAVTFIEDCYHLYIRERVNIQLGTLRDSIFIGRTSS